MLLAVLIEGLRRHPLDDEAQQGVADVAVVVSRARRGASEGDGGVVAAGLVEHRVAKLGQ